MPTFSAVLLPLRLMSALVLAGATSSTVRAETLVPTQLRSEARALMQVCRNDYNRLCSKVAPGGGRIIACLQAHASELNSACAQAIPRAQALKDNAAPSGATAK